MKRLIAALAVVALLVSACTCDVFSVNVDNLNGYSYGYCQVVQ